MQRETDILAARRLASCFLSVTRDPLLPFKGFPTTEEREAAKEAARGPLNRAQRRAKARRTRKAA